MKSLYIIGLENAKTNIRPSSPPHRREGVPFQRPQCGFGLAPAEDACLTWCKKPSDKLSDASASFQQPEYRLSERYRLARKAMLGSLARRECPTLGQTSINGPGFVRRGCLGIHQVLHLSILTEMAIVHRQCHSRARSKSDDDYGICL